MCSSADNIKAFYRPAGNGLEALYGPTVFKGQAFANAAGGLALRPGDRLAGPLVPLGFAILSDKLRPDAAATLAYFKEQGVTVKVISGDNAQAAAQVAISVNGKNLRNGGTATLTASTLNPITVTVTQGNAVRVYTLNITGAAGG